MQFLKENSLMGSREAVAMVKIDLITGFLGAGKTILFEKICRISHCQRTEHRNP